MSDLKEIFETLKNYNVGFKLLEDNIQLVNLPKNFPKEILEKIKERKAEIINVYRKTNNTKEINIIEPLSPKDSYELSGLQKRIWVLTHLEGGSKAYNMPFPFVVEGNLMVDAFKKAAYLLIERHEVFRTVFVEIDGSPRQKILKAHEIPDCFEIIEMPGNEIHDPTVIEVLEMKMNKIFNLSKGPLIKFTLLRFGEENGIFLLNLHHIIGDGWSLDIILRDLMDAYESIKSGGEYLPVPLRIQYKDYANWINQQYKAGNFNKQRDYWNKKLTAELPLLEFPTDSFRPNLRNYYGDKFSFEIDKETTLLIKKFCKKEDVTLFMFLVSVLKVLLYRYTNQNDIIVGTPVAGRLCSELEDQVGLFINTLPLRTIFDEDEVFNGLLASVKETILEAFDNQEYGFDRLLEDLNLDRDLSRSPLFDIMVVLQNPEIQINNIGKAAGLKISPIDTKHSVSKYDITFNFMEKQGCIKCDVEYDTDLFKESRFTRLSDHFLNILQSVLCRSHVKVNEIDLLTKNEYNLVVHDFNATKKEYPKNKTIMHLYEETIEKFPLNTALIYNNEKITYKDFNNRVLSLATVLKQNNIGREDIVAIITERSVEMLVAIYAVMRSGAAYLPVDPNYPEDRINYIVKDSNAKLALVTDKQTQNKLLALDYDKNGTTFPILDLMKFEYTAPTEKLEIINKPNDLAYVIYTSGSTGYPKGVMIEHKSLLNRIYWMQKKYPIGDNDVLVQKTPITFDVSVWELFWWSVYGASLSILKPKEERDIDSIINNIKINNVSVMHFVPSIFNLFLQSFESDFDPCSLHLRHIFCSGEALGVSSVKKFHNLFADTKTKLHNLYGPTEATVDVTYFDCENIAQTLTSIPIGKPIFNTSVFILDKMHKVLPIGVPGEICLAGDGLARSYLNRDQLTNEKFINIEVGDKNRIYKTGDIGYWTDDGNIIYIGRSDFQVKIKGVRVEIEEIQFHINSLDFVDESVVLLRKDNFDNNILVAFYKSKIQLGENQLRGNLKGKLPESIIPQFFVKLEQFPLTNNGKIDIRALNAIPMNNYINNEGGKQPSTPIEKMLKDIWGKVLGVSNFGINDNFFNIGGDSIKALTIISELRKIQVFISLEDLFKNPTVEELAPTIAFDQIDSNYKMDYIEQFGMLESSDKTHIPNDVEDIYPLSNLQSGLVFQSELNPNTSLYHDIISCKIIGVFEREAFKKALGIIFQKHPILRSTFDFDSYSEPMQVVHKNNSISLNIIDIRKYDEQYQNKLFNSFFEKEKRIIFNWDKIGLIRIFVHQLSDNCYRYTLSFHDSLLDGWSVSMFNYELFTLYYKILKREEVAEPIEVNRAYAEFINLEKKSLKDQATINFWDKYLEDYQLLKLPYVNNNSDSSVQLNKIIIKNVPISKEFSREIEQLSESIKLPIKSVLLATHIKVMSILGNIFDVLTGIEHNGRPEDEKGRNSLGLFLNTVPFRVRLEEESWLDLILKVYNNETMLLRHRRYPYAKISRSLGNYQMINSVFNFVHFHILKDIAYGDEIKIIEDNSILETEFPFRAEFRRAITDDHIEFDIHYNSKNFDQDQISYIGEYYINVLKAMVENVDGQHHKFSAISKIEKELLLKWNSKQGYYPKNKTFYEIFEDRVNTDPDRIVIKEGGKNLTYYELFELVNLYSENLLLQGVVKNDKVCVLMDRNIELLAVILACFRIGAIYIPLEIHFPQQRILNVCRKSNSKFLVVQEQSVSVNSNEIKTLNISNFNLDIFEQKYDSINPNDPAYIIFTSGSTGEPKGAAIAHNGMINHIYAKINELELTNEDVIAQTASTCFDISIWQFLTALCICGKTHIFSNELLLDAKRFIQTIEEEKVTVLEVVPSYLNILLEILEVDNKKLSHLRYLVVTGEELKHELVERWFKLFPNIRLVNAYGPTEASDDITHYIIKDVPDCKNIPIGKTIQNLQIYIMDKYYNECPIGVAGAIYVSGVGVGLGYINDKEKTEKAFFNISIDGKSQKVYKTGDIGRWKADGNIEFLGREDFQVKIRGFRIELHEIENTILGCPEVKNALVTVVGTDIDKQLCVYLVLNDNFSDTSSIKNSLINVIAQKLPEYMIPKHFVFIPEFPLNNNGKIDRKKLIKPEYKSEIKALKQPQNKIQEELVNVWKEVLSLNGGNLGINTNFFDLGGDSLKLIRLANRISEKYKVDMNVMDLFNLTTIEKQSNFLENASVDKNVSDSTEIKEFNY